MKWLLILVWLSVAVCSVKSNATHGFYDNPESATARHEIVAIDSTIRQLYVNDLLTSSNNLSLKLAEYPHLTK